MRPASLRAVLAAGSVFMALACAPAFAGVQAAADKEVTQQQVAAENAFPLHFSLSFGGESKFVFRGVNILPEVALDVPKAATRAINLVPAINGDPSFRQFLASKGLTPQQFINSVPFPTQPVKVSRESGIYYVEGNMSAYNFTLGAFYATQSESRVDHSFFGGKPLFDSYREFDAYLSYSRAVGPVQVSLGGTFYHVINNSDFDTAELNFGVAYTPAKFQYVTASFSYNYAGAFNFSDYRQGSGASQVRGSYLDGHYLDLRLDGDVPIFKRVVRFNPYILVAAGSGILPRAFNPTNIPTYVNTERLGTALQGPFAAILYNAVHKDDPGFVAKNVQSVSAARASLDPQPFDRSFDLSSFQTGFRVPFYLTRYLTLRGDFNYSRPLGNLDREPYKQRDEVWGGGKVILSF